MASKIDLTRRYLDLQRERKFDELLALLADDVVLTMPVVGTVSGKDQVEQQLRNRPAGGPLGLQWSDPEEQDDGVRVVASGSPLGPVSLLLRFADGDKISKIDIAVGGAAQGGDGQQMFQPPPLNMAWAKVPTERPPLPGDLGPEGFTLRRADAGSYAWAPDHWPYENDTPRGAWPAAEDRRGLSAPYTIYDKHEVWADSAADLYEQAIQERWAPATDISWGSIEPLPEHVEAALDQVFTNISEQQYNSMQRLMGWLMEISYGYHEVKLYLSTEVFELARHVEAFRKRALANGGGLGAQMPGFLNRTVFSAFKFTEFIVYVNILRASFTLALVEWGDRLGRSQADRQLFDNTARDLRRHLTYGVEHLKQYLRHDTAAFGRVQTWLNRGEAMYAADLRRDKPLREALILALGDSVEEGKARLKDLRQAQLQKYLKTLEAASYYNRAEQLIPQFARAIEEP